MGGGERHQRRREVRRTDARGGGEADGGVRVDQLAGLVEGGEDGPRGLRLAHRRAGEEARAWRPAPLGGMSSAPTAGEGLEGAGGLQRVALGGLEVEPLEVGGGLDVHRRARGGGDLAARVAAALERPAEDVVGVERRR